MIRIRGIVKAAQQAQQSLQVGITPANVPTFKRFVSSSVETIEKLCAEALVAPDHLPSPARSAYYFLKGIDLNNLPVVTSQSKPSPVEPTIGLKNIKTQQRTILDKISQAASSTPDTKLVHDLAKTLQQMVTAIEEICAKHQATPANLTSSSGSIYAWMKFLTDTSRLQLHIQTTQRLQLLGGQISSQHQQKLSLVVELTNLAGLYKVKHSENAATLTISEGFINASEDVLKALVSSALLGKNQDTTRVIRDFASSEEFSDVLLELDLITEAIAENPKGKCYNLDELFIKVNQEYFAGALVKPRLTWSKIHTYRKFGHYEPARDRVVMSLTLDESRIPEYVVEFVLYHELLHKYHGARWSNSRRMVHTPEFRTDERKFKFYKQADSWLKKLAGGNTSS